MASDESGQLVSERTSRCGFKMIERLRTGYWSMSAWISNADAGDYTGV
jgi:hypothetical protein